MIKKQSLRDLPVLLIDSGKGVPYIDEVADMNVRVQTIDSKTFNHGGTRQWGMELCARADVYVFLTQDAILFDEYAIENLIAVFADEGIGCAYGRQIPHENSGVFGKIARSFNYARKGYIYMILKIGNDMASRQHSFPTLLRPIEKKQCSKLVDSPNIQF